MFLEIRVKSSALLSSDFLFRLRIFSPVQQWTVIQQQRKRPRWWQRYASAAFIKGWGGGKGQEKRAKGRDETQENSDPTRPTGSSASTRISCSATPHSDSSRFSLMVLPHCYIVLLTEKIFICPMSQSTLVIENLSGNIAFLSWSHPLTGLREATVIVEESWGLSERAFVLVSSFSVLIVGQWLTLANVCLGHATGHQLHDLRFADLAYLRFTVTIGITTLTKNIISYYLPRSRLHLRKSREDLRTWNAEITHVYMDNVCKEYTLGGIASTILIDFSTGGDFFWSRGTTDRAKGSNDFLNLTTYSVMGNLFEYEYLLT
ncbi:hypothetical protein V1478_015290 [Vespula squamosa]|uniref:Uncharacterized protein n=1 Tax=Vespula squamosa TaxID=30214 RepID=A0ABD2A4P0_VESSQ